MKLGEDVLLEIVEIVRTGLSEGKDISDLLRDMDLDVDDSALVDKLVLSPAYRARKGRVV